MPSPIDSNITQVVSSIFKVTNTMKIILHVLVSICFCAYLYVVSLILRVFFATPHIRGQARYVLFAHMLISDSLYLADGLFLLLASTYILDLPVPICYVIMSLAIATFRITPCNLAAMALERYAAICFPLRHVTLCTSRRSHFAIAIMWFIGVISNVIDFIILHSSVDKKFFSVGIICNQENVTVNLVQSLLRSSFLTITLVSVGLIIVFTYIRVMCIARTMSSRHGSGAGKTVLLHAVQFLLCLFSLTSPFLEARFRKNVSYLSLSNFLIFTCLPRFLSPIIYGLRDQLLSKCIRNLQLCKTLGL